MKIRYIYGWIFVRPRRWFLFRMVWASNPNWSIRKHEVWHPKKGLTKKTNFNIHWWVLRKIIFEPLKWMYWDGHRYFCTWENGRLKHRLWLSKFVRRIGETTAGMAISGYAECFHCGHPEGNQVDLSEDDTGKYFKLTNSGRSSTPEGVDYWFEGITTCPKCGYRSEYGDGSL